jgi:hypothetical protein
MQIWWQQVAEALEAQEATQDQILTDLGTAQTDLATAQADLATAQADLADVQAAQSAQLVLIEDALRELARLNSYTAPTNVLTAADVGATCTITVAAHTRVYPGAFVDDLAVSAGSITGLANSTTYFVYYDDPTLEDDTPTYLATTIPNTAQVGAAEGRHFVGFVTTPADGGGTSSGSGGSPPGYGGGGTNPLQ